MKNLALLLTLVSLIMATFPVHAGVQGTAKANDARTEYDVLREGLLQRLRSKDPSLRDTKAASRAFKELRFAYAKTPQYNPYGGIKAEVGAAMKVALKNEKYDQALEYAEKILKENFVDIDAHMVASTVYRKTGNQEKADCHRAIVGMLIQSILGDGYGDKPQTAMEVISIDEEYAVLSFSGLRATSQAVLHVNGHNYDRLTVIAPVTGKSFDMYFCIDKLLSGFKIPPESP
jgi:hypothetical protein